MGSEKEDTGLHDNEYTNIAKWRIGWLCCCLCCPLYAGTVQNREDMQGLFRQIGYSATEIAKDEITTNGVWMPSRIYRVFPTVRWSVSDIRRPVSKRLSSVTSTSNASRRLILRRYSFSLVSIRYCNSCISGLFPLMR